MEIRISFRRKPQNNGVNGTRFVTVGRKSSVVKIGTEGATNVPFVPAIAGVKGVTFAGAAGNRWFSDPIGF